MAKKMPTYTHIVGIDEVGRGPIAGPVAVGALCVAVAHLPKIKKLFRGVKESKQLSEEQRERWFRIIKDAQSSQLLNFHVAFQSERIIDMKGLSYAIRKALDLSLYKVLRTSTLVIESSTCRVLLDGGLKAPSEFNNQQTIIKGDEKELVIALASICAKVLRDRKMNRFGRKFSQYGFEVHKGYGTKKHYEAIRKYGVLPLHRKLFLRKANLA